MLASKASDMTLTVSTFTGNRIWSFLTRLADIVRRWLNSYQTIYCRLGLRTCPRCRRKAKLKETT